MAQIPIIQDSATLEVGTGRRRVQASGADLGAAEASGLAQLGQGVEAVAQAAAEIDDTFAEAEARDLDNQFSQRLRLRLDNDYLTQRGRGAVEARATAEADVDAIRDELAANARPRAQALFLRATNQRRETALGRIASHANTENERYLNTQTEARLNEFIDNAVAGYADAGYVQEQVEAGFGELNLAARRLGWDEDTIAQRQRQFQSDVMQRTIVQLATTDPAAAEELYTRIRPELTADDAAQLLTTMRAARRQGEDDIIDQAWVFVSEGRRVPPELWGRVPGRARIDIQNEIRRRAEGGAGGGDRILVEDLRVMAVADPERFAQADLRAVRSALGPAYDELAIAQAEVRRGGQRADVVQQRTAFNALRDVAATTLNIDLTPAEGAPRRERDRAAAFNAALLSEVEAYQAANPGAGINGETAQILIGRAYVGMRGSLVDRQQGRVEGARGRERLGFRDGRGTDVPAVSEVVVPYASIPPDVRLRIGTRLQQRLGRVPTQGEVENAYAAYVQGRPLQVGGGE